MAVGDADVFPGFLKPVLIRISFQFRLNRGSNSQPTGHEYDTLTTEPPGRGLQSTGKKNSRKVLTI